MNGPAPSPCDAGVIVAVPPKPCAHPTGVLAATVLGSSLAFIDGSVVNVALPTMQSDLGIAAAGAQWVVNAYLLLLSALVLLGGAASDHFGRRRIFSLGVVLFIIASLAAALAPDAGMLITARSMQGVGAAFLVPSSLAILGAAFSDEERGRAIGVWAAAGSIAGAAGPLIGGILVDHIGWRPIFLINLPLGAAALWLARAFIAESRAAGSDAAPLDWAGAVLATAGLAACVWGLTAAPDRHWNAPMVVGALAAGIVLLIAFVVVEWQRGKRAMLPLSLFATRTFVGVTALTVLIYGALGGLLVLLPFLLIRIEHYSATAAGAALLPLPLMIGLLSRAAGGISGRIGARVLLVAGPVLVALGFFMMMRVSIAQADYWTVIAPALFFFALGMATTVAPLTATVMDAVDRDHAGVASGVNNAVARVAGLVAVALIGFVLVRADEPEAFVDGFRVFVIIGGCAALLAALTALLLISPPMTQKST